MKCVHLFNDCFYIINVLLLHLEKKPPRVIITADLVYGGNRKKEVPCLPSAPHLRFLPTLVTRLVFPTHRSCSWWTCLLPLVSRHVVAG